MLPDCEAVPKVGPVCDQVQCSHSSVQFRSEKVDNDEHAATSGSGVSTSHIGRDQLQCSHLGGVCEKGIAASFSSSNDIQQKVQFYDAFARDQLQCSHRGMCAKGALLRSHLVCDEGGHLVTSCETELHEDALSDLFQRSHLVCDEGGHLVTSCESELHEDALSDQFQRSQLVCDKGVTSCESDDPIFHKDTATSARSSYPVVRSKRFSKQRQADRDDTMAADVSVSNSLAACSEVTSSTTAHADIAAGASLAEQSPSRSRAWLTTPIPTTVSLHEPIRYPALIAQSATDLRTLLTSRAHIDSEHIRQVLASLRVEP